MESSERNLIMKPGDKYYWVKNGLALEVKIAPPQGTTPIVWHGCVDVQIIGDSTKTIQSALLHDLNVCPRKAIDLALKWCKSRMRLNKHFLAQIK